MSTKPTRILPDLNDEIKASPPICPKNDTKVHPGDLSRFVPYGNGVYGYQDRGQDNPFRSAPLQEACGGVIYFDNEIIRADFEALMRITGVQPGFVANPLKHFAVFVTESDQPGRDGYIKQMRLVSRFGLRYMFRALTETEYDEFPEQEMSMLELFWSFISQERLRWGFGGLQGLFGGDGNFAREELCFGFMVENEYHNIYRIWSRAWLITK